jgi:hypothetical protein
VPNLLSDVNAEGHVLALVRLLESEPRREFWNYLGMTAETFQSQRLDEKLPDIALWNVCQDRNLILVTGNRNEKSTDSLGVAIRLHNRLDSWPVVTIGDPFRLLRDAEYANRAADSLLAHLIDIEMRRGAGRLYIP